MKHSIFKALYTPENKIRFWIKPNFDYMKGHISVIMESPHVGVGYHMFAFRNSDVIIGGCEYRSGSKRKILFGIMKSIYETSYKRLR